MLTWRMTIPKTATLVSLSEAGYLIQGTGSPPVAQILMPPPDPTPISTTPPPEPDEDHAPFVWPSGGPSYQARDFDRNYPLDTEGHPGADYYALEREGGNPSIYSHRDAGVIAADARTSYGRAIGGLRLWVRVVAGEDMHGRPLLPAPPHLIRRALKQGHL